MPNLSRGLRVAGLALLAAAMLPLTGTGAASASNAQSSVVSQDAASWTPHLLADAVVGNPKAFAVTQYRQTTYVGGQFHAVEDSTRTTSYLRRNLVAFDAATGAIKSWAPRPNGHVWAIRRVGNSVYVGGEFTRVSGVKRPALVKLNATTGAVVRRFKSPIKGGRVSEIRMVHHRLIVGGTFAHSLLALNPRTGKDTKYIQARVGGRLPLSTGKVEVHRFAVNPAGTRLVAVGNFTRAFGHARSRAFMLNLSRRGASLNHWYYSPLTQRCRSRKPTLQAYLEDVDFSPRGNYFVVAATGYVPQQPSSVGRAVCDAAARFETRIAHPKRPTWINYTGGDTLHAVAATGSAVYVQGHNRWLDNPYGKDSMGPGAVERRGIGALNPGNGKALPWNPSKPAAQGGQDFFVTSKGLWIVSDSTNFGGSYRRGIAYTPLPY